MKALVWEAPRTLVIREQDVPAVAAGEVLVKVAYAGICGSELSGYLGHNALRVPPLVMGHEFAGEIVAVSEEVERAHPELTAGRAVTVNPLVFCGSCDYCEAELNHLCSRRQLLGAHRPGGFAEYVSVPAKMVTALPPEMSLRIGALAEPAAVGVRIAKMAGAVEGEDALVIGAGPIGLLALQALRARGAGRVFIADLDPARLSMGDALGGQAIDPRTSDLVETVRAATKGRGVSVSVDAVGTAATRAQAVGATRSAGTVVFSGLHEESGVVPAAEIIRREIVVRGSFAYTPADFAEALDALSQGAMRLDPWIIEAPLAEGNAWFERLIEAPGDVAKVLLVP